MTPEAAILLYGSVALGVSFLCSILEAVLLPRGPLEELSVAGEAGPPETCHRRGHDSVGGEEG